MNIVANAQANFEFNNAKRISSSTPKTALRLYASAGNNYHKYTHISVTIFDYFFFLSIFLLEKKYLEVLSSNPNDIQTNLNLAETLRSKMTLIKKVEKVENFSLYFCKLYFCLFNPPFFCPFFCRSQEDSMNQILTTSELKQHTEMSIQR